MTKAMLTLKPLRIVCLSLFCARDRWMDVHITKCIMRESSGVFFVVLSAFIAFFFFPICSDKNGAKWALALELIAGEREHTQNWESSLAVEKRSSWLAGLGGGWWVPFTPATKTIKQKISFQSIAPHCIAWKKTTRTATVKTVCIFLQQIEKNHQSSAWF